MPETIVHLPDGKLLHVPEGADVLASVRQYGDQQAAVAQQKAESEGGHNFLSQLAQGLKSGVSDFWNGAAHGSTTEKTPITLGSVKADPLGELERFLSPNNLGGLTRDGAILAATAKAPELMSRAMPSPSTIGQGIEGASRGVPQKILGTDVPLRQMVESAGKSLQTPERNVAGFDRYAPNKGAAPVDREALTSRVPYASSAGEEIPQTAGAVDGRSPWELSSSDIDKLKQQGFTDEQIWRGRKPAGASDDLMKAAQGLDGPKPAFDWPEAGGRYEADASGSHKLIPSADGVPDFLQSELHSGYNNGHVLPEGMAPTERLAQASSGLETPHTGGSTFDVDYGGFLPDVPKFDYEGGADLPPASVGEMPPPNPLGRLELAKRSLDSEPAHAGSGPTLSGMSNYTDWAQGMDDIINSASEEDMPNAASSGLARSRPTNAIKDWMTKLQQTNGRGWPFSEIQP